VNAFLFSRLFLNGLILTTVVLFVSIDMQVHGFDNIPLGRDAKEIADRQYAKIFSGKSLVDPSKCNRGEARPWFSDKHRSISSWYFKPATDIQSVEAAVTVAGDTLTIVNRGCEYYTVSIRFAFAEEPAGPDDRKWWYNRAAEALLRALELGARPVFDL